ncbi:MAG TPA: PDZ domain-containing protein, partial [Gammaproteobacteria bacterium]|nr:PDZ domain-containing protein [Gammaproteobacteria bacterium]
AEQDRAKRQKELAQAQQALQEAAARVAALSMDIFNREFKQGLWHMNMSMGWGRLGINLGEPRDGGLTVQAVTPGGAADQAGIRAGDTLQSIAGVDLGNGKTDREKLSRVLDALEPGSQAKVTWTHGGESHHAMLKAQDLFASLNAWAERQGDIMERHAERAARRAQVAARRSAAAAQSAMESLSESGAWGDWFDWPSRWNDMELATLTPQLGQYFGVHDGLLVVRAPDDAALKLRDGDVILTIGGRAPNSPTQAMRILRSYTPGDTIEMTVMRDRKQQKLTVALPQEEAAAHQD